MGWHVERSKGGVKSLFDGWLTEASSDGDGGYIDLSHGINFGFGSPPGYPFGRHDGLDIGYPYGSKLYSTMSGTGTGSKGWNGGFGNNMWLNKGGPVEAIYGHVSELAWTGKKKVKPGRLASVSLVVTLLDKVRAQAKVPDHIYIMK